MQIITSSSCWLATKATCGISEQCPPMKRVPLQVGLVKRYREETGLKLVANISSLRHMQCDPVTIRVWFKNNWPIYILKSCPSLTFVLPF